MSYPLRENVLEALKLLKGCKLSGARNAAATKLFHFDEVTLRSNEVASEPSLHVQCAWRISGPDGIVTGTDDRYLSPENPTAPYDFGTYDRGGDLQDKKLAALFSTQELIVTDIDVDACGGMTLQFSGGYVLQVLPTTSVRDAWSLIDLPYERQFYFPGLDDF